MKNISVLDCTLRDGGYCNGWGFGKKNTQKIISKLVEAGIDIIECGFLKKTADDETTLFSSIESAEKQIENAGGSRFALMVNYGDIEICDIPEYDGGAIDIIRVAFHKKDLIEALKLCEDIKNKGYKVFVQAMVSLSYTKEEFLQLVEKVNAIKPYAFYIVDSFGVMKTNDLIKLFDIVDKALSGDIVIGFHSHNNMQLSYSNAQIFCALTTTRRLIVDSSVMGMGRGAGNLNTELFTEYLNNNHDGNYDLKPLLQTIDKVISGFYQQNAWGYSLPNYLSAKHNLHPNYARFLDDKKTLSVEDIDEIFSQFDDDKKYNFDKEYIKKLYFEYMTSTTSDTELNQILKKGISGKTFVLIAPGKTAESEKEKIIAMAEKGASVMSVHHNYPYCKVDYVFLSNMRKARDFVQFKSATKITTTNIRSEIGNFDVDYASLLNDVEGVKDNAGLMAIKLLIMAGAKKIYLAGFDGYSYDISENYTKGNESVIYKKQQIDSLNSGMNIVLNSFKNEADIEFLTTPKHLRIEG